MAESSAAVGHQGGGGFVGVALAVKRGEKGEAHVGAGEIVALIEAADAEGNAGGGEADKERAEAVTGEALDGAVFDVGAGLVESADAAVADEAEPRGVVEQCEHEGRVVGREWRQGEAGGGEDGHGGAEWAEKRRLVIRGRET